MFLPTPDDMRKIRLELNLTQNELASRAGVSQPLVARIESGDVDPRLSTLRKIFNAFDSARKERILVRDIMHSPVIHTSSGDSIEEAAWIMEEHGFSQMPVIDNGVPVGSISTDQIVRSMTDQDIRKVSHLLVQNIMDDSFPTISQTTDTNTVSRILEQNPAVLVLERGKVIGVVTKHDIMRMLRG
ncbi:putative transcriptional regulator [Candidatus Methanoperedens nitroreducens]|uniref:Putative transcriptional regulator n=1 Tax=Candidatus Methanoperedens nitratireducens TaxID=1392998 RepID=A0A062V4K6_9EURY|nr:CBS domain-containing protein [Candidatus Methanoperedens nitroreducens]KCZ71528.1 putative transcriptional regulator [Candidatus Methanoperedens nitroreducens]MDJ1421157.1 CBS domain-containing protein [Candidatus Methanoperedens sp.]